MAETRQLLDTLAENSPTRSANVRTLARFAANSDCRLATLGFAVRVDFDRLLDGTRYAAPFGQSPFAFRRGIRFEERLRADRHALLLDLLRQHLGYSVAGARVENLREGFPKTKEGMKARALRTEELVREIVRGGRGAPNLLDGAVLESDVGGIPSYFEADAVAARFQEPIHAGEVKSFPTVDGQADPENVGAAMAQVAIYILLLRRLVARVGGDPALVSADALLITPRNTGLQPTLTIKNVGWEIDRARRILDHVPPIDMIRPGLPDDLVPFAAIAAKNKPEEKRAEAARRLIQQVGNCYRPECLATCGLSRLCRELAEENGDPYRIGGQLVRLLPQIKSIDRAGELANGGTAKPTERPVAEQLVLAQRLLDRYSVKLGKGRKSPA